MEYSVFTNDGLEHIRQSDHTDTELIMSDVLAEFDESQIETVTINQHKEAESIINEVLATEQALRDTMAYSGLSTF